MMRAAMPINSSLKKMANPSTASILPKVPSNVPLMEIAKAADTIRPIMLNTARTPLRSVKRSTRTTTRAVAARLISGINNPRFKLYPSLYPPINAAIGEIPIFIISVIIAGYIPTSIIRATKANI